MALSCLHLRDRVWKELELELDELESLSKLLFFTNSGISAGGFLSSLSYSDDECLVEVELLEVEDNVVELELDWCLSLLVASKELFCYSGAGAGGVGLLGIVILVIGGESG